MTREKREREKKSREREREGERGNEENEYAKEKEERKRRKFFLLAMGYMISISWVFGYSLKQPINSCTAFSFPVPLCRPLLAKMLSVLTSGKHIWQEHVYDSFAGIQSRNSQPATQLFLEMDLFIKGACWCYLELMLGL